MYIYNWYGDTEIYICTIGMDMFIPSLHNGIRCSISACSHDISDTYKDYDNPHFIDKETETWSGENLFYLWKEENYAILGWKIKKLFTGNWAGSELYTKKTKNDGGKRLNWLSSGQRFSVEDGNKVGWDKLTPAFITYWTCTWDV